MTVQAIPRRAGPYIGTGSVSVYSFGFKTLSETHLRVVQANEHGVESDLLLNSDYTVQLNADQDAMPGGTITLVNGPLLLNRRLTILSLHPYAQTTDVPTGGTWDEVNIENALDKLAIQVQQLDEIASRTVASPPTSGIAPENLLDDIATAVDDTAQHAAQANASAVNAASSAAAAAASATNAATSATNAATGAINAANSATAAADSATAANNSKNAAATSATNAATSATAAANSATNAANSATAAANSATAAANSATNAANSATAAANSAANAAASATAAANSATAAANSATAADNSATVVQTAATSLGALAALPPTANTFPYYTSSTAAALTPITADARAAAALTVPASSLIGKAGTGGVAALSPSQVRPLLAMTRRELHTWAIPGEIKIASGQTDYIVPFYVEAHSTEQMALAGAFFRINGGTSATVKLTRNTADIPNYTDIVVTTSFGAIAPSSVTLNSGDLLGLVVTAVSGTPVNMTFTVRISRTWIG